MIIFYEKFTSRCTTFAGNACVYRRGSARGNALLTGLKNRSKTEVAATATVPRKNGDACIRARTRARKTAFRIVVPLGNWFGASLNFYSLRGTYDKKIAQTENPQSFLSCYTRAFHPFHRLSFYFFSSLPALLLSTPRCVSPLSASLLLIFSSPFLRLLGPPFSPPVRARYSPRQSFTLSSTDLA